MIRVVEKKFDQIRGVVWDGPEEFSHKVNMAIAIELVSVLNKYPNEHKSYYEVETLSLPMDKD